jgi:hypothetical protein
MGKQHGDIGNGSSFSKQQSKIRPLHELSSSEKNHLRRSGHYIPPAKLTFWQELKTKVAGVPSLAKNVLSFKTLGQLVNASVLIGAITFIAGEQGRRDAQVYQAWQVINSASDKPGSGGRIQALEFLNSTPRRIPWFWLRWERELLTGLEAPKAYLVPSRKHTDKNLGIQLSEAQMQSANLQGAVLAGANLQGADLDKANLQGANLYKANLQGADLTGANLQKAYLINANLQGANLYKVNLQKAQYTDNSTSQQTCNSFSKNYPCPTIFPPNFDPKAAGMVLAK